MSNIDTLQQQTNGNQAESKEQLFRIKPIKGTPFHTLNKDGFYYLTLGNNLMSPPRQTEEEIAQYIIDNTWNLITSLILILIEKKDDYVKHDAE